MKLKGWLAITFALVLSFLNPLSSSAAPIAFQFAGEVTSIDDPGNVLGGTTFSPTVGDPILGIYVIDSTATGFPLSPTTTSYNFSPTPPSGMVLQIGGTFFEAFPGFMVINISNDDPSVGDRYLLFTEPTVPTDVNWLQVGFELGTTTNLSVFDDTSSPLVAPNVSLFESNEFFLSFVSDTGSVGFVTGEISSVTAVPTTPVPEPSTLFLIAAGLASKVCRRRPALSERTNESP